MRETPRTVVWRSGAALAAQALGMRIIRGDYPEGARLPREEELAQELSVSRNTLREAMKLLAAKSLVRVAPRRGTLVLDRAEWNVLDSDVMDWAGPDIDRDKRFLQELGRIRQIIEPAAAFDAAHRATRENVTKVSDAYAGMRDLSTHATLDEKVTADLAFHVAVADASGNRFFQSITRSIIHALRRSFEALIDPPGNYEANLANHRAVLDAIRIGDPEGAQAAMMRLLQRSEYAMERLSGRAIECEQDTLDEGKETS